MPSAGRPTEPADALGVGTDVADDDDQTDVDTLDAIDTSGLTPERRSRGLVIAIALLTALVAFGGWYGYRTMQKVAPPAQNEGVTPQDAPATPQDSAATTQPQ